MLRFEGEGQLSPLRRKAAEEEHRSHHMLQAEEEHWGHHIATSRGRTLRSPHATSRERTPRSPHATSRGRTLRSPHATHKQRKEHWGHHMLQAVEDGSSVGQGAGFRWRAQGLLMSTGPAEHQRWAAASNGGSSLQRLPTEPRRLQRGQHALCLPPRQLQTPETPPVQTTSAGRPCSDSLIPVYTSLRSFNVALPPQRSCKDCQGREAQDGHLDFRAAPELWTPCSVQCRFTSTEIV